MTTHKEALEAAYLAGFNASGEGYNGEYPFGDRMQDPAENRAWKKDRDNYIKEALMFFQDGAQPSVSVEHSATHGEPVAWGVIASNTGKMCQVELDYDEVSDINSKWLVPLYTTPPQSKEPEQEPVAWMCHPFGDDECEFSDHQECENCIPLYTTPPQRTAAEGEDTKTWVGLTDDEVIQIRDDMTLDIRSHVDFYRHCEAKLKAKNERKEKNT